MSYTKSDIINNIALETSLSKKYSKKLFDQFIKQVISGSNGSRLKISSFGTFYTKKTIARLGRNPKTGQEYKIPVMSKLRFIPSNKIKQKIN
jgi:nucleoid DNA-binding protein